MELNFEKDYNRETKKEYDLLWIVVKKRTRGQDALVDEILNKIDSKMTHVWNRYINLKNKEETETMIKNIW